MKRVIAVVVATVAAVPAVAEGSSKVSPLASAAHRHGCHGHHTCPSDHATYRWRGLLCVKPSSPKRNRSFNRRVVHDRLTYYCKR